MIEIDNAQFNQILDTMDHLDPTTKNNIDKLIRLAIADRYQRTMDELKSDRDGEWIGKGMTAEQVETNRPGMDNAIGIIEEIFRPA